MQQPQPMISMMASSPPTNVTTEQIQKYLDENKMLILAILDNQNLGKLSECAQYQAQLQNNLMYLAAIADGQPQAPTMPPQMAPHPSLQQGAYYMQHPQVAAMAQQSGIFSPKMPLQFNSPHQIQDPKQLRQAAIQGQMGMRPMGANNGIHPMHTESALGSIDPSLTAVSNDASRGSKQYASEAGATGADAQRTSGAKHGGGDGSEDAK